MFDQKIKDEYDLKLAKIEEKIVTFNDLYNKQLNYFRSKFKLKSKKHKISIVTYKNNFDFEFINLQEAKLYYEDILKKWKSDIYIKLDDHKTIGTSCITNIEFETGNHPEEYTQEEIDKWADEQVKEEMKNWKVVKGVLRCSMLCPGYEEWIYDLKEHNNDYRDCYWYR